MFYKKKGMPESGDIVLCTVKKILYHSVFVYLDEYQRLEGMVHISEVSPGRIRNLRDYVKESKRIVCKVLNINAKGNIDLSLRRVNKSKMIEKLTSVKQEEKAEKLLEYIGKQIKKPLKEMYTLVGYKAIEEFRGLNSFFESVVIDESIMDAFKFEGKEKFISIVKDKIKIPEVKVSGILSLKSYEPSGIEDIKKVLMGVSTEDVTLTYVSAPNYKVEILGNDYKTLEGILKSFLDNLTKIVKKYNILMEFNKDG